MGHAVPPLVLGALGRVAGADELPARSAHLDFIGREDGPRLLRAGSPVPRADQAPRLVGAAQMLRAVHLPIYGAHGLMRRADRLAAARALRHLVHAHRLVGSALTVPQALRAQTAASLGRIRVALLRVPVADDPPAAAARRETFRAGHVPALGADAFVHRAVRHAAGLADARVLLAGGLLIHAAAGDAVVRAEVLLTDRAARRAGLAAAVVVPADHQGRGRAAAVRACHAPGSRTAEGPLRADRRGTPPSRLELPLGALHQDGCLDELQGMHDGLHLAAPDLFGTATLGERRDGSDGLRVGLLLEDRLEVPVQPAELGGNRLLRRGTPRGHPLRRLFLEMAQDEPQQVGRLPGRDGCRFRRVRRIRGLHAARLQVPERTGHIVTHFGAGRQVAQVAVDDRFLDPGATPQLDAS